MWREQHRAAAASVGSAGPFGCAVQWRRDPQVSGRPRADINLSAFSSASQMMAGHAHALEGTPRVSYRTEGTERVISVHGVVFAHYDTQDRGPKPT